MYATTLRVQRYDEEARPALPRDVQEILTSALGSLYGRATQAAVLQAWDVLNYSYHGDGVRFKRDFLDPVLGLLKKLSKTQAVSECPTSTWPVSVGSSVVIHLSRRNCRYLRDIGDFCVCVVVSETSLPRTACVTAPVETGSPEPSSAAPTGGDKRPAPRLEPTLLLCDLTFDGLVERRIDVEEFPALLTMDWARRVREAPDHELSLVLRQCMVASEYVVRHLRWDDLPQFDPNLKLNPHCPENRLDDNGKEDSGDKIVLPDTTGSELGLTASDGYVHPGYTYRQNQSVYSDSSVVLPDSTIDESSTDPPIIPPISNADVSHTTGAQHDVSQDLTFHTCPNSPTSPPYSPPQSSRSSPTAPPPQSNSSSPDWNPQLLKEPVRTQNHVVNPALPYTRQHQDVTDSPPRSSPSQRDQQNQNVISPATALPILQQTPSRCPNSPSTLQPPMLTPLSAAPPSLTSPISAYGTWHGRGKHKRTPDPRTRVDSNSSSGDPDHVFSPDGLPHTRQDYSGAAPPQYGAGPCGDRPSMQRTSSSSYLVRRQLPVPVSIVDVDNDLLHSGVAILPGCLDEDGRSLVYIFTCSILWQERRVNSTELAALLMYYNTVPRHCSSEKGFAVVADIRGSTTSTINVLLEALYLFQDNVPEGISIVHLFGDRNTQQYVIKSPLYDSKASVNLKLVLSFDHLQQYVSPDQIPTVLDGHCAYNHESWVRFRKKLEPFMVSCRTLACRLVDTLQDLSRNDQMPRSVAESAQMMATHERVVKATFEDEKLRRMQADGPTLISSLRREQEVFSHSQDYRLAMDQATNLHQYLQDTISRVAHLADTRLTKLHNCLQLREYEDECHKVINWLTEDGDTSLARYQVTADNLRAVRHQQKDFDKFYFAAMSYIEKGNDLLEEANMLSQCGNFSEATGYKDLAKTLKQQLQVFTGQLEEARERIEGTARCYHLLDKSYEWALEAMKYVSSMRMEHTATGPGLEKLLRSLNVYLAEHPPVSEENFAAMLDAAQRLRNEKLLEQCRVAKARCQETHQLLQLRQNSLRRARNQMEVEHALKEDASDSVDSRKLSTHDMAPLANINSEYPDLVHSSSSPRMSLDSQLSALDHSTYSVFSTPSSSRERTPMDAVSSSTSSPVSSSVIRRDGDGEAGTLGPLWEPKDSSTPANASTVFTNYQGGVEARGRGDGSNCSTPSPLACRHFDENKHPSQKNSSRARGEGSSDSPGTPDHNLRIPPSSPHSQCRTSRDTADLPPSPSLSTRSQPSPSPILPLSALPPLSPASSSSSSTSSSTTTLHQGPMSDSPSSRPRQYEPSPYSSPISRLYNSSPTRSPGLQAPRGTAASKLALGRTISQPASGHQHDGASPRSLHSLPSGGPIPSSRPLKKIMKRASTAPIPMLGSPILEEDPQQLLSSPGSEDDSRREDRSAKSISMITGSSESLHSMGEEDETDLDASPSHDGVRASTGNIRDWAPLPVNTHLHRSAQGTPTGPMADLRLTEAEIKSRRTVSLIMSEMIQTERDYVRALHFITDHYVPELQREDVPQMLRGKRTVIFGNLEKIQQFHSQYFLRHLEACQTQPFLVGQYFLQHETMFYLYALYNKNKPKSDCLMMEFGKDFFREKQIELGDKMDLSSYLLKPVQRMGKYALLLKQLLKECNETDPEYPELKAAEEMVKFQLRHGNDLLAMDSLRDCDVNLPEQGRLLRQEEFLVFQGRKKSMRRIFLFEDLILFSKTRRGRQGQHDIYVYKYSFKTADIGMTENFGDSGYKFEIWFRRRTIGDNYILQAPTSEVKKAWVRDISRILWRQAIRNRESRINELATMGIGNKPCLDIKPSEDNIQDRSINVSFDKRGARTRNSIAVSSFDYLRNGNKRPHSIISVSSTSSSGSSQSSFGLLGSLNLAFDPLDSPRLNRRSFVSNESGIVADGDTSIGDTGSENQGPSPRRGSQGVPSSGMRSYLDVMKSRVLKQKFSDQVYTDV